MTMFLPKKSRKRSHLSSNIFHCILYKWWFISYSLYCAIYESQETCRWIVKNSFCTLQQLFIYFMDSFFNWLISWNYLLVINEINIKTLFCCEKFQIQFTCGQNENQYFWTFPFFKYPVYFVALQRHLLKKFFIS